MAAPRLQCKAQYKKADGLLLFANSEFSFTVHGQSVPDLRVPYFTVKCSSLDDPLYLALTPRLRRTHPPSRRTAQAQNKNPDRVILKVTQEATNGQPETNHNLTFPPPDAAQVREKVIAILLQVIKDNIAAVTATATEAASTAEDFQIRQDVLNQFPDLRRLHASLVVTGVVSEDDFWRPRQQYLVYAKFQKNQRKGASGAIVDIRPVGTDGGQDVKFRFTDDVVASIMTQFPPVRRAYEASVPKTMNAAEFLRRFVESKYYQRRGGAGVPASDQFFAAFETEDDDDFVVHPTTRARFERNNMLLDLGAPGGAPERNESGNRPDATMRAGGVRESLPLIRQLNRVSDGILKGTIAATAKQAESSSPLSTSATPSTSTSTTRRPPPSQPTADELYRQVTDLEDLRKEETTTVKPLEIGDVTKYFNFQNGDDASVSDSSGGLAREKDGPADSVGSRKRFRDDISGWDCKLAD
ncbi:RNA polymerase II transcription factor B subunit 1, partial [Thoreauomyces humboldtii]